MRIVKIAFDGFWNGFHENDNFIINILRKYFEVEIVNFKEDELLINQVEYLFYSYFSKDYLKFSCIRIFYTGENIVPDFNLCDYAIGFENIEICDRYFRYPITYALYIDDYYSMLSKHKNISQDLYFNREFCSRVVSNGDAIDPYREQFYEVLSDYKRIDSGGRYKNNIEQPEGVISKINFESQYRFSLAFENSSHKGYCTEKLVQSFAAKTVPIYWGDPDVNKYFNPKSFINCMDYKCIEDVIQVIMDIDETPEKYLEMLKEPAIISVEEKFEAYNSKFEEWIIHIFEQQYEASFRRCRQGGARVYEDNVRLYINLLTKNAENDSIKSKKNFDMIRIFKKAYRKFKMKYKQIFSSIKNECWTEEIKSFGSKNPNITFYVIRRRDSNVGLFSIFNVNLGHIRYAFEKGYVPVIDMMNYENAYLDKSKMGVENSWEYYFEQPTKYKLEDVYQSKNVIISQGDPLGIRPNDDMRFFNNYLGELDIWKKYTSDFIKIKDEIMDNINIEYEKLIKETDKVLGVLLRGTDYVEMKPSAHPKQPDYIEVIKKAEEIMKERKYNKLFLATEDYKIFLAFKEKFGEACITNERKFIEYKGGRLPEYSLNREKDKFLQGKEYLTTIFILSKCKALLASRTSGTVGAMLLSNNYEYTFIYDLGRYK